MAANVTIRQPRPEDVDALLADMRPEDYAEVEAMCGDVRFGVEYSLRFSRHLWAFEVNGRLAALLGVASDSMLSRTGTPWMLGTTEIDRHVGAFVRHSRPYYDEVRKTYPHLMNYVDARNRKSIRWLKWLGFQFEEEPQPMGVAGLPFYKFEIRS